MESLDNMILFLDIYTKLKAWSQRDTCIQMFMMASFAVAKTWNKLNAFQYMNGIFFTTFGFVFRTDIYLELSFKKLSI